MSQKNKNGGAIGLDGFKCSIVPSFKPDLPMRSIKEMEPWTVFCVAGEGRDIVYVRLDGEESDGHPTCWNVTENWHASFSENAEGAIIPGATVSLTVKIQTFG